MCERQSHTGDPLITSALQPEQMSEKLYLLGTRSSGNVFKVRHKQGEDKNKRLFMDLQVALQC